MDLLLANAYHLEDDPHERAIMRPYPPLGILYLSAWLKQKGRAVGVYDGTFQRPESFAAALDRHRPRAVGIYVTMLVRRRALEMIAQAKERGIPVVVGGPEPPHHAEEFLKRGADAVVVGEGERTVEELLPALLGETAAHPGDVAGVVALRDGRAVRGPPRPALPDLGLLPLPDRDAAPLADYFAAWRRKHGVASASLITARGCPFRCTWCSHAVYGYTHRRRPVERVADEVQELLARFQPEQLWYADDVFTLDKKWSMAYFAELDRRGVRVPYECISRADRLDEALIDGLAATGARRVWIGSESGSQRILDAMKRGVSVEEIRTAVRGLQKRGIRAGLFVMLGFDGEEEDDIAATIDHLQRTAADEFLITVAYPIKGTEFAEKQVAGRLVMPGDWARTTDRDVRIAGRRSDGYYRWAVQRVVEEVRLFRMRNQLEPAGPLRRLKAMVKLQRARLGMRRTRHERVQA